MTLRRSLNLVLIDLSGTLHIENEITSNAVKALQRLRDSKVRIKFVTNTTKESRQFLHERLSKLGFIIEPDEIWSSLWAARDIIISNSLKPMLLVDDAALEDFAGLTEFEGEPNAVVIGLAPNHFHYDTLNKAFRLLLNGAKLIAIHKGRYYKTSDGLSLGPGPFVQGLEFAGNCTAQVVGKPSADFFKNGLGGVDPSSAVMIGDDVRDDIEGAQSLGLRGFLVKTGKYREGDECKINPPPYRTVDSFSVAVDEILKELNES